MYALEGGGRWRRNKEGRRSVSYKRIYMRLDEATLTFNSDSEKVRKRESIRWLFDFGWMPLSLSLSVFVCREWTICLTTAS